MRTALQQIFPEVEGRRELRKLQGLVSVGARSELREELRRDPELIGRRLELWLPASSEPRRPLLLKAAEHTQVVGGADEPDDYDHDEPDCSGE